MIGEETAALRVRVGALELSGVHGCKSGLPVDGLATREIGMVMG